jgi:hypothetical protein
MKHVCASRPFQPPDPHQPPQTPPSSLSLSNSIPCRRLAWTRAACEFEAPNSIFTYGGESYKFYPGRTSPGHAIPDSQDGQDAARNRGNVYRLAAACARLSNCMGCVCACCAASSVGWCSVVPYRRCRLGRQRWGEAMHFAMQHR